METIAPMLDQQNTPASIVFEDATDKDLRVAIEKFYNDHPEQTLKTLVCRAYGQTKKEYIAIVTRGDKKVDLAKIRRILDLKNVRLANKDEMIKLGLAIGYVSPIDCHEIKILCDTAVEEYQSYYDGGNRELLYRKNVNFPRDFAAWKTASISL